MVALGNFIGGSKGDARDARPLESKFFHFHAVFRKSLQNNSTLGVGAPLRKILDPPLVTKGNHYIPVCTFYTPSKLQFSFVTFTVLEGI